MRNLWDHDEVCYLVVVDPLEWMTGNAGMHPDWAFVVNVLLDDAGPRDDVDVEGQREVSAVYGYFMERDYFDFAYGADYPSSVQGDQERSVGKGTGQKSEEGSMDHPQTHYVYMVCCANGTLYIGYTTNVERRIALHNAGKGGRYTRSHRPVSLIATWTFNSKGEALRAERELKRLPRKQKLLLAEQVAPLKGEGS